MIVSHVWDESELFLPNFLTAQDGLDTFLGYFLPGDDYSKQRKSISSQKMYWGDDARARAKLIVRDSIFTCNTRFVYDAFSENGTVYMLNYGYMKDWPWHAALHASDLLPTFWSYDTDLDAIVKVLRKLKPDLPPFVTDGFIKEFLRLTMTPFAYRYRHYLVSHAISGNPNQPQVKDSPCWAPGKKTDDTLGNVMETKLAPYKRGGDFNVAATDSMNTESTCQFWRNMTQWLEATKKQSLTVQGGFLDRDYQVEL